LLKCKSRSQLVALAAVAVGLLSGGAGVASAAPAVFSTTGGTGFTISGVSVTYGPPPGHTLNCLSPFPASMVAFNVTNSGSPLQGSLPNPGAPFYQQSCFTSSGSPDGGTLIVTPMGPMRAESNGGAFSLRSTQGMNVFIGLIGQGTISNAVPFTVPWTNPSGPNPSKFTFSHTLVGYAGGGPVYLSATFTKFGAGALSLS
jgi:hypothetical protein